MAAGRQYRVLGRNDDQVKSGALDRAWGDRGATGRACGGARGSRCCARGWAGDRRLVAYYTARRAGAVPAGGAAQPSGARLPEHMVPAAYVRLEALPLTPNGKLDRQGVPAPERGLRECAATRRRRARLEELLAAIWAELLRVERVGRHDHFFERGGHSLLAVQLVSRVRQALQRRGAAVGAVRPAGADGLCRGDPERAGEPVAGDRAGRRGTALAAVVCAAAAVVSGADGGGERDLSHCRVGCGWGGRSIEARCGGRWTGSWRGTRPCARRLCAGRRARCSGSRRQLSALR